ncbi:uridine phosphorylase 2-like [Apostichopus japonicus]|uniref:uridine phosphorylase 2-like n=1 Tax=Stichopus japonicus TaxID=307972 RepID=UPI003AB58C63
MSVSTATMSLPNPFLSDLKEDILFHLGPNTRDPKNIQKFRDTKFVIIGGTPSRMKLYAEKLSDLFKEEVLDFTSGDRYAFFKVGPVVTVSHGVGLASVSVVLHEIIKLLYHAQCEDVALIRTGTCGGIGVEPGTVVVTRNAVNDRFQPVFEFSRLGETVSRSTKLCSELADSIMACQNNNIPIIKADTMCAEDFYECQGRLDGAICEITKEQKMAFLQKAVDAGVRNIEMESCGIAALCNACGVKAAVVCVTLIDRLKGDQLNTPTEILRKWEQRPFTVIVEFIKEQLKISS